LDSYALKDVIDIAPKSHLAFGGYADF